MSLFIGSIVINVSDVERAKKFWTAALNYVVRDTEYDNADATFVVLADPQRRWANISLQLRPEPKPERNRLHLDLYSNNQEAEVERLMELGAIRLPWHYDPGDDFVVLADPDGNEFCVVASSHTQD